MANEVFRKSPLALAVSLAMGGGGVAYAQEDSASAAEAQPEEIEEVLVVGIRQSLKASMDLKRDRDGVVDAITAEDIGDFPDGNLAESLQRITGVSIDRERGEGARVTVRGFGPEFNLVLLNGRQMPTSDGVNRSFDFGNLAAEGIAAVEVYKSGQANVPTGGIGSTLNIRTTRPLEAPGMNFTAAVSALHDTSTEEGKDWTPEVSALFSNTFAEDTFGIALSAVRQERNNAVNTAGISGYHTFEGVKHDCWGCPDAAQNATWGGVPPEGDPNQQNRPGPDDLYSVPQAIRYEMAEFERVRTNGQLTLQWQPSERLTATLDYTYSELELERTYNNLSAWFNFGAREIEWGDGPQATPNVYTENLPGDFSMGGGDDAWVAENGSTGLNLLWDVTDRLSLEFDYHDSNAKRSPDSPYGDSSLFSIAAWTRVRTTGYFGEELPILEVGLSNPLSPDDMQVTGSVFTSNYSKMDIEQAHLSGSFDFDFGFIENIDFGVQLTEVNNRSAQSVVQRQSWNNMQTPLGAIADLMRPASADEAFDEIPGGDDARRQTDFYTFDMVEVIRRTEELMASGVAPIQNNDFGDLGPCGTALCAQEADDNNVDRRTKEESVAAYLQANMSVQAGSIPVDMRFGLRYEKTDVSSQALVPSYTGLRWSAGNEFALITAAERDFTELDGSYEVLLPNFDLKVELTDSLVWRASYSETITRPNYADIQGGQTVAGLVRLDGGDGNRGNPALKPFESQNVDLSLEWYYGEDSYVAAGYFFKDVKNFIGTANVTENLFNLPHPGLGPLAQEAREATGASDGGALYGWILNNRADAPGVDAENNAINGVEGRDPPAPFNVTIPVNIEQATMRGWEMVIQHNFGETGFGAILNATLVEADVGYDNFSLAQQFVLTGLSDSANIIAFYDKNGISVRLAYNWRDNFLGGIGQDAGTPGQPNNTSAYQQLDMSASYWFTDRMQVYLDVLNMTNETAHTYGRDKLQTLLAIQQGTRYNLGFRYKL